MAKNYFARFVVLFMCGMLGRLTAGLLEVASRRKMGENKK
jgi:hypothetical protein